MNLGALANLTGTVLKGPNEARNVTIEGSVGTGGMNLPRDVRIVQDLLNRARGLRLATDGAYGPRTQAALMDFQRSVLSRPQAKIDSKSPGFVRLVEAAREQAGPPKRTPQEASGPTDGLRLTPLPRSKAGMYSYAKPEEQFGTSTTIDTMVAVARDLAAHPLGLEVGVGHVSYEQGGNMPPHKTHRNGRNVDLRPLCSDGGRRPVTITDTLYDRERTRALVDALLKRGTVTRILFNDKEIEGVRYYAGHHNHLHVEVSG